MKVTAQRTAYIGVGITLSLMLSYVETLLPLSIGIPGAKIGLPNILTLFLLYKTGVKDTVIVSVIRIILIGFLFGNLFLIAYSFSGFVFAIVTMALLKKFNVFDMYGVSVSGAVMHNMGQLFTAFLITNEAVFVYFPMLLLAGVVAGLAIGITAAVIYKKTERFSLFSNSRKH